MDCVAAAHYLGPQHSPEAKARRSLTVHLQHQRVTQKGVDVKLLKTNGLTRNTGYKRNRARQSAFEKITPRMHKMSTDSNEQCRLYLCGTMVISRSLAMRSGRAGWVLSSVASEPPPKSGFTMQRDEVEGVMAFVGIRLL